jgi:hypothetical protein
MVDAKGCYLNEYMKAPSLGLIFLSSKSGQSPYITHMLIDRPILPTTFLSIHQSTGLWSTACIQYQNCQYHQFGIKSILNWYRNNTNLVSFWWFDIFPLFVQPNLDQCIGQPMGFFKTFLPKVGTHGYLPLPMGQPTLPIWPPNFTLLYTFWCLVFLSVPKIQS